MNNQENLSSDRASPGGNDYLSELIKSIMSAPDAGGEKETEASSVNAGMANTGTAGSASTPPPMGDLFSSLLSNPELLSKLPSMISTMKPIMDILSQAGMKSASAPASASGSAEREDNVEKSVPTGGGGGHHGSSPKGQSDADRRAALLCAMKPYLGPDRQNAIDYIIKLSRLGDILKSL